MATIDIKDFLIKQIAAKFDRILMTNSQDADTGTTISVQDFCLNVIQPLIESLSLTHSVLKQSEYDALEVKKEKTFYIIKESGRIFRTYIGANPLTDGETFFRVVDDFWQISYDGGKTYADILDNNGKKVSAKGDKVILRLGEIGIEYKYENEADAKFRELVPLDALKLKFADLTSEQKEEIRGEHVYLQKTDTHIQWKIGEAGEWKNLVELLAIKGDTGNAAVLRREGDFIQTQDEAGQWMNLYDLRELGGLKATLGTLDNVNSDADNMPEETRFLVQKVGSKEWNFLPLSKLPSGGGGSGEGGGATTLGGLENVVMDADMTLDEDYVLCKLAGSDTWILKKMSELGGGGGSSTVQRNVRIVNNLENKNLSASKGDPCYLNFTFVSQERYGDEPYENTGERGMCQILIKNTVNSEYAVVKEMYVASGNPISVDIAEYLTSGSNQVMVKVTGEVTEVTTPAFVYTVTLTSLSISADNFKWWTAFSGNVLLPLNIGGNVSKTLHVTVSGEDYSETYQVQLGTSVYIETAYNYSMPHPGKTGVFAISVYVANSDGSIRTRTVSFNIICVTPGAQAKLIAVNNVLPKATNWIENRLFDYTMYDGDAVYTSAEFIVSKDGMQVFASREDNIAVSTKYSFTLPLEIETMDNTEFSIVADAMEEDTKLMPSITYAVNNSLGYSAMAGAKLYINPRMRSNRQENYKEVINEMDASVIPCSWRNMNWGNDGWTTDSIGNKVLRLMAGASLTLDYKPFKKECARIGKTIEIDYLVSNVTDFSKPVITISDVSGDSFIGLNIYADDMIMHSQSLRNDEVQNLHTFEGKRIRLALTILPDAYGNSGFNLCILYVNGVKNREFTYENNDYFAHNGNIVIGSDFADVDIYGIREYDSALTSQDIQTNYVNWLSTTAEKAAWKAFNDILDSNGSEIDFENTKDQFNVLVFDNIIPSMSDQTSRTGTLEALFCEHPEWNVSISNVAAKGQGTSSMKYWIWNTRYQLDKNLSVITHADGTTSKKVWQMVPWIPAGQKFTAKKNFASSMQSHKIGAVNSYDDLFKKMGLTNEAMLTEKYADARVAVYQLPFFCFEKSINEEGNSVYTFRGLYTFGPDKGDKYCFGHDTDLFPGLMSIEGSDNSPLLTLFRMPWNTSSGRIAYNEDEEAFQYNGANSWDFGGGEVGNIDKWIPAYNMVYQCSPRLKPFNGTLQELNAQVATLRTEPYEFWIAREGDANQYNVYYFESAENKFIPSDMGEGTINLVAQLVDKGYGLTSADLSGKTIDELNALFIKARIQKFRREAPRYWDIDDCLFFANNVEFNAGTDERAKNTYPYCFGMEGSKWKWRVDDADTRFDTTNRGLPNKSYSVEVHDVDATGASVWNGETNNFFNLLELAFPDEKIANMRRMMTAIQELGGLKSGNDLEKLFAFYQKYYFNQAQEYFPANGYNADAKYCYENGKLAYIAGLYSNDTDPITQSLGDHYQAEQRWITKRILYMMSKYSFGLFSAYGTDTITVRAAGNTIDYELIPAIDLYPAISNGTSIIRGSRTKAGEVCLMTIELSGTGDQQNAIQGASYLMDIGDWHDKNVTGSMIIQGRMLREIKLGSVTQPITISISSLTISNCVSLQKLILSNISTLSGTLNLAACSHLKEVYAGGTSLAQLILPKGGGLEVIEYPATNQYVSLSNYPLLTTEGVMIDHCKTGITDFFMVDCPLVSPMEVLVNIMNAQAGQGNNHALKRIRAVGFDATYDSDMLDRLASLADGSYVGLSSEGVAGEDEYPVLDGRITINGNCYEDSVEALRSKFKKLELIINDVYYIRFADDEVRKICAENWGDGKGITREQAAKVTSLGNKFQGNSVITSFEEFKYFTGVTVINDQEFQASNLKDIILPGNVQRIKGIYYNDVSVNGAFKDTTNLSSVIINENCLHIYQCAFRYSNIQEIDLKNVIQLGGFSDGGHNRGAFSECKKLNNVIASNVKILSNNSFYGCDSLIKISIPSAESISGGAFNSCISLVNIKIGDGTSPLIITGNDVFKNCKKLEYIVLPKRLQKLALGVFDYWDYYGNLYFKATIPPILEGRLGGRINSIYVPIGSVEAYKNATNWKDYASLFIEYDFDINPDNVE